MLFDTGKETSNAGDHIIMENCYCQLDSVLDLKNATHVSTHVCLENCDQVVGKYKIVCGTNILSGKMRQYGLWKLPRDLRNFHGIILMGVGFDSKNIDSDLYSRWLLRYMLSRKAVHSVRDTFSERKLKTMGVSNVIYTACPTMWRLTPEHCASIPLEKASKVVCTITDYNQDVVNDRVMIDTLLDSYESVYLWLQGRGDLDYIRELGYEGKLNLIPGNLADYDAVLEQDDLDYVGTRLHAGIRALSKGRRSLIVSIDNRAECIHADTGLPIIHREDISIALRGRIEQPFETKIDMPWENIERWKGQFL